LNINKTYKKGEDMNDNFDIEKIGRQMPYRVPDGFFEHSYQKIMSATVNAGSARKPRRAARRRLMAFISAVAGVAAVVLMALFALQREMPTDSEAASDEAVAEYISDVVNNMSDEELDNRIEYTDPDMYMASY